MPDLSLESAKKYCERLLKNSFPSIPVGFENTAFTPPATGVYLLTQFTVFNPTDNQLTLGYHRENCQFQVLVMGETNTGTSTALQLALQIRQIFNRGTSFTENSTLGHILNTPQISGSIQIGNRFCYPVLIPITLQVNT